VDEGKAVAVEVRHLGDVGRGLATNRIGVTRSDTGVTVAVDGAGGIVGSNDVVSVERAGGIHRRVLIDVNRVAAGIAKGSVDAGVGHANADVDAYGRLIGKGKARTVVIDRLGDRSGAARTDGVGIARANSRRAVAVRRSGTEVRCDDVVVTRIRK